jgi:hypothetical protein
MLGARGSIEIGPSALDLAGYGKRQSYLLTHQYPKCAAAQAEISCGGNNAWRH